MKRFSATLAVLFIASSVPASIATPKPAAGETSIEKKLAELLHSAALRGSDIGVLVVDKASGTTLLAHDPERLLVPASVTKVFTTATALKKLTPQYTWRTELLGDGALRSGTYKGNLYLKGYGDPAFVSERALLMVDHLRKRGIRQVTGDLVVDDSYFDAERYGKGWGKITASWYDAPIGALSYDFNARPSRGRYYAIHGDPALNTGKAFLNLLEAHGIKVAGKVRSGRAPSSKPLEVSLSRPLGQLVADVNKISNNFMAEMILKTLGADAEGPPGTADKGLKVVAATMATLGVPTGFSLNDGSGLSKDNLVSATQVVKLLLAMSKDFEVAPEFVASLKVAGAEGALSRFRDALCQRNMRVKTGHLDGVDTLAGYALDKNGRELVFAVLVNDLQHSRGASDRAIERICELFLGRPQGPIDIEDSVPPVPELPEASEEEAAEGGN